MSNKCRICDIVAGKYLFNEVDKPILENEEFFAIASIGAFIEGWTLVLPKRHCYSMRNFWNQGSFEDLLYPIIDRVQSEYGEVIVFEHGANSCDSKTSCGTHHAHIHVVPYHSLKSTLLQGELLWEKLKLADVAEIPENQEYLFYAEMTKYNNPKIEYGLVHRLKSPISQFFRTILAQNENKLDTADYKKFHYQEISEATHRRLQIACAPNQYHL